MHRLFQLVAVLCLPALLLTSAPAHADEEEDLPDGCFKSWLCYKPPSDDIVHPELEEKKFQAFLAVFFLGPLYVPWVISDAAKRPALDEDLKDHLLITIASLAPMAGYVVVVALYMTIIGIPLAILAYFAMAAALLVMNIWVRPITELHIVNRQLTRDGKSGGKRKSAPAASDDDDE